MRDQPPGAITVFLPSPGTTQATDAQAVRLIADANAIFRRMDAEMNALAAMPRAIQSTVPASSPPHLWQVVYRRPISPQG